MAQKKIGEQPIEAPYTPQPLYSPRMIPAMPLYIVLEESAVQLSIQKLGDDTLFRMTDEQPDIIKAKQIARNVYALRDEFLRARTEADAIHFLLAAGGFRARHEEPEDRLLWSDFQNWQIVVRSIMSSGPLPDDIWSYDMDIAWIDHITEDASIRSYARHPVKRERLGTVHPFNLLIGPDAPSTSDGQRRRLRAEVPVGSILQGILAATFLDALNGMEYRLCSLADCTNIYEVTSKHGRQYCSQACAHHASVRRRRASTAKAKTPDKKTIAKKGKS